MKTSRSLILQLLAIGLCALAVPVATALAGPEKWASIKATAACGLSGSDLTVTVGYDTVKEGTPDPLISQEVILLEQRVGNQWVPSGSLFVGAFDGNPHSHTFAVTIQEGAKSLRATVVLTVDNANPSRPTGREHLAACDAKVP